MNGLQQQITALNDKVDGLYQVIETLNQQIRESFSDSSHKAFQDDDLVSSVSQFRQYSQHNYSSINSVMEHKDILSDGNGWEPHSDKHYEKDLSPDIQIRRLTAQLTAAYNRIAALEEQLISRRIHS